MDALASPKTQADRDWGLQHAWKGDLGVMPRGWRWSNRSLSMPCRRISANANRPRGQATQINACRHPNNDSGHGGKSGYRRSVALQHLGLNCSRGCISSSSAALIGSPSIDQKIWVSGA